MPRSLHTNRATSNNLNSRNRSPTTTLDVAERGVDLRTPAVDRRINDILDTDFVFNRNLTPENLGNQIRLQAEYVTLAEAAMTVRAGLYQNSSYDDSRNMNTQFYEAGPAIAVAALQGGISSAARTPSRNALITKLDPEKKEFSTAGSRNAVAGVFSGSTAYVANEIVNQAIDRAAASGNLAKIEPIAVHALLPKPNLIILKITDGTKFFTKLAPDSPEYVKLEAEHRSRVDRIVEYQNFLKGDGPYAATLQPLLTGLANTVRRGVDSTTGLGNPSTLFATSALASGSAGATTKAVFSTSQVVPWVSQIKVTNFVGGMNKVNLFDVRAPDAKAPAAGFMDIFVGLSRAGGEAASLAGHAVNPMRSLSDIGHQIKTIAGYVASNAIVSVVSTFVGLAGREVVTGKIDSDSNERHDSKANMVQQFSQSAFGEWFYKLMPNISKSHGNSLGKSLDNKLDIREANYRKEAVAALNAVSQKLEKLLSSNVTIPANMDEILDSIKSTVKDSIPVLSNVTNTINIMNGKGNLEGAIGAVPVNTVRDDFRKQFKTMAKNIIALQKLQGYRNRQNSR